MISIRVDTMLSEEELAEECRRASQGDPCPLAGFICPFGIGLEDGACGEIVAEDWREVRERGLKPRDIYPYGTRLKVLSSYGTVGPKKWRDAVYVGMSRLGHRVLALEEGRRRPEHYELDEVKLA